MQVGNFVVIVVFDAATDGLAQFIVTLPVEQDLAGVAHETDRPAAHKYRADDAHQRIHPDQSVILRGEQGEDRQQ